MYVVTLVRSTMMHDICSKHNKLRINKDRDDRDANAL